MKKLFFCLFILFVNSFNVFCKDETNYPELLVTPRASQRLLLEAKRENTTFLNSYDIYLASTLFTTFSGFYNNTDAHEKNPDNKDIGNLTIGVGGTFTLIGAYLATLKRPYHRASKTIGALDEKSIKAKLIKERIAEEQIDSIATFNKRLRFFTGVSQIGLGIALLSTSHKEFKDNDNYHEEIKNKKALHAGGLNIAMGIINIFLPHSSEIVARRQKEYKKKIYSYILPKIDQNSSGFVAGIIF